MRRKKYIALEELENEMNFSDEELIEIELEKQIIEATIEARKKAKLTQKQLSEKTRNNSTKYCKN